MKGGSPEGAAAGAARYVGDYGPDTRRGGLVWKLALAMLGAFLGLRLFAYATGAQMGLPRFDAAHLSWQDVPWACLLAAAGYALVLVYRAATVAAAWLSRKIGERPVLKATLCGAALGALGLFLPGVLFSGEEQTSVLMGTWSALPAWALTLRCRERFSSRQTQDEKQNHRDANSDHLPMRW